MRSQPMQFQSVSSRPPVGYVKHALVSDNLKSGITPKHASWLNQIEIWFSILVRKLIRRGNFSSKQVLKTRIEQSRQCR